MILSTTIDVVTVVKCLICIGGAKVYNLGGLKGRGRVSDRSFTHHAPVLWLSPQDTQIFGGAQHPKPVIRAAYVNMVDFKTKGH